MFSTLSKMLDGAVPLCKEKQHVQDSLMTEGRLTAASASNQFTLILFLMPSCLEHVINVLLVWMMLHQCGIVSASAVQLFFNMTWTVWSVYATCQSDLVRQLLKTGGKLHGNLPSRAWCLLWSESHSPWLAAHILEVCGHFFSFNTNLHAVWLESMVGVINDEDGHFLWISYVKTCFH